MAREQTNAYKEEEVSLLDRRSYLKLAGSAAAAVSVGSASAAAQTEQVGYGAGGYGQLAYGETISTGPLPTVDEFTISKSGTLGNNRMFSVRWSVSTEGPDLDTVEVVVVDGASDMNFGVTNVNGASASGWKLFQFSVGSSLDVTVRVTDSDGNVTKETKSITL